MKAGYSERKRLLVPLQHLKESITLRKNAFHPCHCQPLPCSFYSRVALSLQLRSLGAASSSRGWNYPLGSPADPQTSVKSLF